MKIVKKKDEEIIKNDKIIKSSKNKNILKKFV